MSRRDLTPRLPVLGLLLAGGLVGIYAAARLGGAGPALLAAVAVACGVALVLRMDGDTAEALPLAQVVDWALLLVPGVLIVFFSLNSGGYFADAPAVAAILLVVVLVLRITLVDEPFAAFSTPLAVAVCALGLLSVWTLLSALWSHSTARALIEFDRTFMYLLVVVIAGSVARTSGRLRALAAIIAGAIVIVALVALATRLFPDRFPTSIPVIGESNLAYPLTYSNALGILCVLGAIPSLYFATSVNQPLAARVLGSAVLPLLATTVYLTLSRGPVAAAIVGIGAFVLLGRPRGLITGLVAVVPASAIAVASAYRHPILTSNKQTAATAAGAGHRVALVLFLCVVGAALLRLLLARVADPRLRAFSLPERSRKPVVAAGWIGLVLAIVVVAAAVNAPSRISDQYHRFVNSGEASPTQDLRQSIFSHANRGIVDNWRVAVDAFKSSPLHGVGAGNYENYWYMHRPVRQAGYDVVNAHSLYVQVLGELGLVGFLLLVTVLVLMFVALAPFRRGANRPIYAALFALLLAWAVHAGIDWDWEMPATTVGALAVGGAGLAAHARNTRFTFTSGAARTTIGLLLLVTVICPALVFASQRQLNEARDALQADNCSRTIDRAASAAGTLDLRPESYELIALCQQGRGRPVFAVQAMQKAVDRDPNNWRYRYELAALQGEAGLEPRPALEAAHRLNPTDGDVKTLLAQTPPGTAVSWHIDLLGPLGQSLQPR